MYLTSLYISRSYLDYFIESGSPEISHIAVASPQVCARPTRPRYKRYLYPDYYNSTTIQPISFIFTALLNHILGYILLEYHLVCARTEEVTVAGTYEYIQNSLKFE